MAEQRGARDRGSRSPASEEAKEQGMAGNRGAQAEQTPGMQAQPEQGSNRSPAARHNQAPEVRKGYEPGQAPSEQGEKEHPSPHVIARNQQGIEPRSGAGGAHSDRSEEEAQRGEPAGEHEASGRHGRQSVSGERPGHRG